jgi:hypothetical protein
MGNTLTAIENKILARSVLHLRKYAVMPRMVNFDWSTEVAQFGKTIDVKIPVKWETMAVTPGVTDVTPTDATPTTVPINLDTWRQTKPFALTDKDLGEVDTKKDFLPMQVEEAIVAMADFVNDQVHATYPGIYGWVGPVNGDANVTPFATTVTAATDARKVLAKQLAPKGNRRGVVDLDAEAQMLALAAFSDAEKVGSTEVKIEGEIGRKFGIDWAADHSVLTHTTGMSADWDTAAVVAIGDTTIAIDDGAGASGASDPVVGDVFTVAGDTQTYVVVSHNPTGDVMTFSPGAKVLWGDDAAITPKSDHVVNLAFHRDAIALAMRPLEEGEKGLGTRVGIATDPVTGISLRLEIKRQHKQTSWEFDILIGTKLVRPELACRIAG